MKTDLRTQVESAVKTAFHGVTLGNGVSLKQAQAIDRYSEGVTAHEFRSLTHGEVTNDWGRVSIDELERNCISHLDAAGFRYYIPALMLSVLSAYDPSSMRVIGTIAGLYPQREHWEYHMGRYSLLVDKQRSAIAFFLQALPQLVSLEPDDRKRVARALHNYWNEFLP